MPCSGILGYENTNYLKVLEKQYRTGGKIMDLSITTEEINGIRKQTRLALPNDNAYLLRLGVALYGFASINSFMVEIICHIDKSQDQITVLSDYVSGKVLCVFRETLDKIKREGKYTEIHNIMQQTADLFDKLNSQRNDFVHSYPITNSKNEQILHRRKDNAGKYFEVNNDFLTKFIGELCNVSDGLYKIRDAVCKIS